MTRTSSAAMTSGPVGRNGLRAYAGPGKGEVTLEWARFSLTGENYTIRYGTQSGSYPFAASYVGYITTYTIGGLNPGQRYYFGLEGVQTGNVSSGISGEVTAVAPRGPVTVLGIAGPVGRNLLSAKPGPKSGQVILSWKRFFSDTQGYNLVYGEKPGKYTYGVLGAVTVNDSTMNFSYTVGSLKSGRRYYFALIPMRASLGGGIYTTSEVSTVAR